MVLLRVREYFKAWRPGYEDLFRQSRVTGDATQFPNFPFNRSTEHSPRVPGSCSVEANRVDRLA